MANAEAWAEGAAIGRERAEEHRARKQALKDEQHKQKITDLIDKRAALVAKANQLKGTPKYDEAFEALRQVNTGLRELYDPQKHPGMIERFGHLLTDHLGITNPEQRIQKEAARRAKGLAVDEKTAQSDMEAGPLSAEQEAKIQTQAEIARQNALNDARVQWAIKNGASPEVVEQIVQTISGVPLKAAKPLPGSPPYLGPDGRYYQAVENQDGSIGEVVLPPGYKPKPSATTYNKGPMIRTKPGQSPTGFAQIYLAKDDPNKIVGWQPITASRFYQGTESSDVTTDPFGVTSKSLRRTQPINQEEMDISQYSQIRQLEPDISGAPQATPTSPAAEQPTIPTVPQPTGKTSTPNDGAVAPTPAEVKAKAAALGGEVLPTDDQGHIPASANVNPGIKEAANQLLDGVDIKELTIPARDKAYAESLARQYGWGRGPYLPRELKQMQNANQFLDMVLNSKAFMKALDEGVWSKTKVAMAEKDASKDSLWGTFWHQLATQNLTPAEQEYVRLRQSMLGTISGLSSVVRSGRPTEATINRLIQEIPDVMSSNNSKDAMQRILNIKRELQVALKQGVPKPTVTGQLQTTMPKSSDSTQAPNSTQTPDVDALRKKMLEIVTQGPQ